MSSAAHPSLSTCLQRLPVELAHKILCDAALLGLAYDRAWAVSLARVSSTVRHVVEPLLHHTMVVGIHNAVMIESLAQDPRSIHVLNSVKRFILTFFPGDPVFSNGQATIHVGFDISHLLIHFTSLEYVGAPYDVLRSLVLVPTVRLRRIALRFSPFEDITNLADAALSHVTHIEGYIRSDMPTSIVPREWVLAILAAVPALTCIAFNIAVADSRWDPPSLAVDVHTLLDIIRSVLERRTIQRVVLHFPRDYISNWPTIKATLSRFDDSRVYVWKDERVIEMWDGDVERVAEEDAWAARDVWTEARPWDQSDLLGTRERLVATAKFIQTSGAFSKPPGEDAAPAPVAHYDVATPDLRPLPTDTLYTTR